MLLPFSPIPYLAQLGIEYGVPNISDGMGAVGVSHGQALVRNGFFSGASKLGVADGFSGCLSG